MTEESDQTPTPDPEEIGSLLGDFDFTPDWARGTPGVQSQPRQRDGRGESGGGGGGRGPRAPDSARRGLQGVRVKPRRDQIARGPAGAGNERRGPDRRGGGDREERRGPFVPRLPVHVDFVPEKNRLSNVVKIVRNAKRAFPLDQIARKFMENPVFLSIKYTVKDKGTGGEGFQLYQCTANGMVFGSREACVQYILDRGLGEYYESEEREVPPPAGNFICVGRHRTSGRLIGPPNWHGYQAKIEELRQELAPGMSPEDFARHIETVHEVEAIEAWKKESSTQVFYRRKSEESQPEAAGAERSDAAEEPAEEPAEEGRPFNLSREQAEKEFLENVVPGLMIATRRAMMPGYLHPHLTDPSIASMTAHHLRREHDRPGSIIFALRPAFKHMRLSLFRHEGQMFVSGVEPNPLPEDQKIAPELRRILDYVETHPNGNAKVALEALAAGGEASAPVLVSHFHWLIEKGHLIEFADGTLALPHGRGKRPGAAS